jgi:hypothetical protein
VRRLVCPHPVGLREHTMGRREQQVAMWAGHEGPWGIWRREPVPLIPRLFLLLPPFALFLDLAKGKRTSRAVRVRVGRSLLPLGF